MNVFNGDINAKIDSKGRAFVPVSFRKILQEMGEPLLVLRKDLYKDCLILHPGKLWEEELLKLRAQLSPWVKEEQELFRRLSWCLGRLEMDSNGRILIQKRFLNMVNITNSVCFYGMTHTIELWNPDLLTNSMLSIENLELRTAHYLGSKPAMNNPNN